LKIELNYFKDPKPGCSAHGRSARVPSKELASRMLMSGCKGLEGWEVTTWRPAQINQYKIWLINIQMENMNDFCLSKKKQQQQQHRIE